MTFRGSIEPLDRFLGALPYLLPLSFVFGYGVPVFRLFPFLFDLFRPILPIMQLIANGGFILFIVLIFLVVRNNRVPHFIRFNTIQAILMEIAVFLITLVLRLFSLVGINIPFFSQTIFTTLFLAVLAITVFAWVQNARGHYPDEIPTLSDAAYAQVRY